VEKDDKTGQANRDERIKKSQEGDEAGRGPGEGREMNAEEIFKQAWMEIVGTGTLPLSKQTSIWVSIGKRAVEIGITEGRKESTPICCICEKHIGTACDLFEKGIVRGRRELAERLIEHFGRRLSLEPIMVLRINADIKAIANVMKEETAKAASKEVPEGNNCRVIPNEKDAIGGIKRKSVGFGPSGVGSYPKEGAILPAADIFQIVPGWLDFLKNENIMRNTKTDTRCRRAARLGYEKGKMAKEINGKCDRCEELNECHSPILCFGPEKTVDFSKLFKTYTYRKLRIIFEDKQETYERHKAANDELARRY